ncbi:MAG: carotenoid synthesis regulator CarF [Sphingomonas sp.]|nr:carotenoid synthesis regulator CarF [Sphingomonas sp.]
MVAFLVSLGLNLMLAETPTLAWLPAALAGWYLADLASGLTHMIMDYKPCRRGVGLDQLYFYEGSRESADYLALRDRVWREIGPFEKLVYDFKNHHPRPEALGRRPMLVQIGSTIIFFAFPASVALNAAAWLLPLPGWLVFGNVVLIIGGTFAQYFHGTLHRADNPAIVRWMREVGLLMTPKAHQLHHDTLTRDFATNNGWSNPLINRLFAVAVRRRWLTENGLTPQ